MHGCYGIQLKGIFQNAVKSIQSKQTEKKKIRSTYVAPVIQGFQKCFKDINYLKFIMARDYRLLKHIKYI